MKPEKRETHTPRFYDMKRVRSDGTVQDYPSANLIYTLEELQAAVSGYIELVTLSTGYWMVVNENGRLFNLPHNALASELAMRHNPYPSESTGRDDIRGDVLVCHAKRLR